MAWILGISALLVLWACVEVGLLYSILAIGIVCGALYGMYTLHKKASQKDATEQDKQLVSILRKVVIGVSVCLIVFGVLLGALGLFNPDIEYYADGETCSWCNGDGKFNGKQCSLCEGWGFIVTNEYTYANHTWLGILMAASGAVMITGISMFKDPDENKDLDTDENTLYINTPTTALAISFGHWKPGVFRNTWAPQEPDDSGAWTVRCHIKYSGNKPARKFVLYVTPYTTANIKVKAQEILLFESDFAEGYDSNITWKNLWKGFEIGRLDVIKSKIYFKDGTVEEIDY